MGEATRAVLTTFSFTGSTAPHHQILQLLSGMIPTPLQYISSGDLWCLQMSKLLLIEIERGTTKHWERERKKETVCLWLSERQQVISSLCWGASWWRNSIYVRWLFGRCKALAVAFSCNLQLLHTLLLPSQGWEGVNVLCLQRYDEHDSFPTLHPKPCAFAAVWDVALSSLLRSSLLVKGKEASGTQILGKPQQRLLQ